MVHMHTQPNNNMPASSPAALSGLVQGLLELTGDKDNAVRETACASLLSVGRHQHVLVLDSAHAYLGRFTKLCGEHRGRVLSVMNGVCEQTGDPLNEDMAKIVANLATQEMCMAKGDDIEWSSAGCSLLVTLSRQYCNAVMQCLLDKFQPGQNPPACVVLCLGSVSVTNSFVFVPFLSDILSRAVPMLHNLKSDTLKRAFASAFLHWAESVTEYLSNIDHSPDTSVTKSVYCDQFAAAYDSMYPWLSAKDLKVRSIVAHCLGEICHILPVTKLHEELKKLIPALLGLYKKSVDYPSITQGLCRVLEACVGDQESPIEAYLEEVWTVLFPQVCDEVDYSSPSQAKNQNEILRCFNVTAGGFGDKIVYYLVQKMQSTNEKHRLGAISVLRHLVNSSGQLLSDKKSVVIFGLKPVLADAGSNKVRKSLSLLAVALADHGYLEAEGGQLVIEFLVKHLVIEDTSKRPSPEAGIASMALQSQCARALLTIANTVSTADKLLWPHLFQFVCVESCTTALPDLYRCLSSVASKLSLDQRMALRNLPNQNSLIPGPSQLLARLIVTLVVSKTTQVKRCFAAVSLLRELVPVFHDNLPHLWETLIPNLQKHLDGVSGAGDEALEQWETHVLKFLSETCASVSEGDWRCSLAAALAKQFSLYTNHPVEKKFLCRCLGGVLAKIANPQFVVEHMQLMFRSVNHSVAMERLGCAQGIGYCASVHIDIVLTKLENVAKWEHQKKSSGILGFIKDNMRSETDSDMVNLRATLVLCYGFAVHYCPVETVTQRLESTVLRVLKPRIESSSLTSCMRESLLYTFDLICRSLHPSHLNADFTFTGRGYLVQQMLEFVKSESSTESLSSCIRMLACRAVSSAVKLSPPLGDTDVWSVCTIMCHHIFPLVVDKLDSEDVIVPTTIESTVQSLSELMVDILVKSPSIDTCSTLIKMLYPWFSSDNALERTRSVTQGVVILSTYYDHADDCSLGRATEFPLMASLFARFCPRFCDSVAEIRSTAFEGINIVLSLAAISKGHGKDFKDPVINDIRTLKDSLIGENVVSLAPMNELANMIDQRLPAKQITTYITVLFEMVADKQATVACAAACLLRRSLVCRGDTLLAQTDKIIETLLDKLASTKDHASTYVELLECFVALAEHHLVSVVDCLLQCSLPLSECVVDCWHKLARQQSMLPVMIARLTSIIGDVAETPPDALAGSSLKYCRFDALAVTCALTQVISGAEPEQTIISRLPELLCCLLMHCGSLVNTNYPSLCSQIQPELRKNMPCPASLVQNAIRTLLVRSRFNSVVAELDQTQAFNDFCDAEHFESGMAELGRCITIHSAAVIEPMCVNLLPAVESPMESHRIVAVAVLSAFVRGVKCEVKPSHAPNGDMQDEPLLDRLMEALMRAQADPCIRVRRLSVRGMGNLAHCDADKIAQYTVPALTAMMAGLEDHADHKDEVAMEAMQGLNKLAGVVNSAQIKKIIMNVVLRIRPCFEKESAAVRCVAFNLLGELAKFGEGEAFEEQLHSNLVALMLHVHDHEQQVTKSCVYTLNCIQKRINSPRLTEALGRHLDLSQSRLSSSFRVCAKDFATALVNDFGDKVNFYCLSCGNYFKSVSPRIRSNAALFIGYLLGVCPPPIRTTISADLIFSGLVHLLHETDTEVKLASAEAIAHLYSY